MDTMHLSLVAPERGSTIRHRLPFGRHLLVGLVTSALIAGALVAEAVPLTPATAAHAAEAGAPDPGTPDPGTQDPAPTTSSFVIDGDPELSAYRPDGTAVDLSTERAAVGQQLTITSPGFSPTPDSPPAFSWQVDGAPLTTADGAAVTSRSIVLSVDLVGTNIVGVVSASASGYTPYVGYTPTVTVTPQPRATTGIPTITGTPTSGQTLSAGVPSVSPSGATLTYRWYRDFDTVIAGASNSTYRLGTADIGHTIQVGVSVGATASGYAASSESVSKSTRPIGGTLAQVTAPSIKGKVTAGSTLTLRPGSFMPTPSRTSYRWLRDGAAISGATGLTYRIVSRDIGHHLRASVTATRPDYASTTTTTASTATVLGTFTPKAATISGTRQVGKTLTAAFPRWSPAPTSKSYRWYRNGNAISGATRAAYRLTGGDYGTTISVSITGKRSNYVAASRSTRAGSIAKAPGAKLKSAPKLRGTAAVGATLTVTKGSWSFSGLSYRYSWYRSGSPISGAAKATYTLTGSDVGKRISAHVTVSKKGYRDAAASTGATGAIAGPKASFKGDGLFKVGRDLSAGTYYSKGGGSCYWERLSSSDGSFDSIIANDFDSRQRLLTISSSDRYVSFSDCGSWYRISTAGPASSSIASNGKFRVGVQIKPGEYRARYSDSCYWERNSDASGEFDGIIANDFLDGSGTVYVTIKSSDFAFTSSNCGKWTKVD